MASGDLSGPVTSITVQPAGTLKSKPKRFSAAGKQGETALDLAALVLDVQQQVRGHGQRRRACG